MLLSLSIRNYALIDTLNVDFHKGLNIITGETGAGKSILLGALGLILGKRADKTVLSSSENKCVVEAEFDIKDYKLEQLFQEMDIDYDIHTVFRREILISGKSRAFVNDTPVNLVTLQELALQLVDIHSQHQNLQLNKQNFLLNIVDKFARNENLLAEYAQSFTVYSELKKMYKWAKDEFDSIQTDIDYLTHQTNELAEAKLQGNELEKLEQELNRLENTGDIKSAFHEATELLMKDEHGIIDNLKLVSNSLDQIIKLYPDVTEIFQRFESVRIELKELDSDLHSIFDDLEFDPNRYEVVKSRLNLIYGLQQKYRVDSEQALIEKYSSFQKKLSLGIDGEFELEKQKRELDTHKVQLLELAGQLSEKRKISFHELEVKVEQMLVDLGIEHGQLKIESEEQDLSSSGIDQIRFLFSANKNHPLNDVSKIASGGELSRLMLAIKALLNSSTGMPTIILDEIDTGVSGDIANKVGNIIRAMSSGMQVINITHLPQVASKAEVHYKVYKSHDNEQTQTLIKKLNKSEQLEEIAKMLSGEEITEAALENARELLNK